MVKKQTRKKKQQKVNPFPIILALFAFLFIAGKTYQITRSLPKTVGIVILATLPLIIFQKKIFSF